VERVERIQSNRLEQNAPVPTQVLDEGEAQLLTGILQDVVRAGTGRRAAVRGTSVAGKTGTNDNYADAWFVGYTPSLAVAVWVGYPDELRPMLTEFGGQPVAGGTLPAEIWKEFVESVEPNEDAYFAAPAYLGGVSTWVVKRGGEWRLDNGYCRDSRLLVYFSGRGPDQTADCKPNEVSVPLVVGMTAEGAADRLAAQPLGAEFVYKPAKPGKLPGIVVNQYPRSGGLSANDDVTVVVSKARYGLLPNFVGSSIEDANRELEARELRAKVVSAPGHFGTILRQFPRPGVAVAPGFRIRLVVGDG
jgi:hypothetical protein